jgi:hypothetical protein
VRLPTHNERAGARVYKETPDAKSSGEKYRDEGIRNFGKTADAAKNVTTMVREGMGSPRPTGQHTAAPRGDDYYAQKPPGAASTDPVVGAAAGAFMVAETIRAVRRARARRRKERDGNG